MHDVKKRVLIVISNLKIAGAQKVVEQLAINIDKNRFVVNVLVIGKREKTMIENRLEENGIAVHYLNKSSGFHVEIINKLNKYVKWFDPDIIHTHVTGWVYAFPAAICHRVKILHTIHSRPNRQEATRSLRALITILYHLNVVIPVAISHEIKLEAVRVYKLPEERIELIYNPVDYCAFSKEPKQQHKGICLVNVARFNKVKNQLFLINAFAKACKQNANIRLVMAGDGELLEDAKELTEKLYIQDFVEFVGNVDNVSALLARCDIFVLPSLTEGLPVSLLEAEAAGLPVIASRVGGIVDIVDDNGILVEVNDERSLVDAILKLSTSEAVRKKMGLRSCEIAKEYAAEAIACKYEILFKKYGRI